MIELAKCTHVKQLANHCVPACLESIARDRNISITQVEIVNKYPNIFSGGSLNDLGQTINLETVIKELGLGGIPYEVGCELKGLIDICKDNYVLLFWTKLSLHCVRVCGFSDDYKKIYIMDPECNNVCAKDIEFLNEIAPSILFFKK